ncbi:MAG: excinuclease ABC subunit UvrC [Steroidobacteraceae bacterium]|nr:excinuclease ABC subunit UvrC [Steroidobacteraceae bacterium]
MPDPTPFDLDSFLAALPARPGVYRMLAADDTILYIGKARHLKNRVSSYFHGRAHGEKTQAMVAQVARVEITVTASETEALLLEYNLIKQHRPRYNILLKDDKSFPYIHLTAHEFPRLAYYRGAGKVPGRFFGPYPNSVAARETLQFLQKLFRLRPCEDTFFANRSRPCLQHQIGRCSAPCVGHVTRESYAQDIADAVQVLQGRNTELIAALGQRMEAAAQRLQYEAAARFRDQIAMLKQIQASQAVTRIRGSDIDAVAIAGMGPEFCVSVVFVRGGRNLGSSNFFPKGGLGGHQEALAGFLAQYYLARESPDEILVGEPVEDADVLEAALRERAGRAVPIRSGVRGTRARWLAMARTNAELGLRMKATSRASVREQLEALRHALSLERVPQRIECFDVSHTMGESAIASCVVFGSEGPLKSDYRRFNLKGLTPGDDYAGMRQAVGRHFARVQKGESPLPDVLLIDGGEGQLQAALQALGELGIAGLLTVGVAKGADRRVGQERLFLAGRDTPLILGADSAALRLIQRVRDEAHRFAIAGHRKARARTRLESFLEEIPGLGPAKRRELLKSFGGLQGVRQASVEDLAKVRGISRPLAELVYEKMNPGP